MTYYPVCAGCGASGEITNLVKLGDFGWQCANCIHWPEVPFLRISSCGRCKYCDRTTVTRLDTSHGEVAVHSRCLRTALNLGTSLEDITP